MKELSDLFWNASLDELKKGYVHDPEADSYVCLVCGESFEKGRIFTFDNLMYDAHKAVQIHITNEDSSMFEFLLGLDKEYTGLTEHQKKLLMYFYNGYSDKEIIGELGGSASNIRNYRFNFREKEKQAKILLAVLELLKENAIKRINL